MRRLLCLLALAAVATAAGASAAGPPRLTPTQKSCVIRTIGKRAYDRLSRTGGAWPATVLAKTRPCLAPKPSAPACPATLTGFFRQTPVDMSLVTSIGPPGQVRGQYKGHGYFRVPTNDAAVVMPADGTLYEGGRYVEAGEVQYLLYFRTPCGLVFLFDHILQPGVKVLAAYAGKPDAKPDDSRTYPLGPVSLTAGEQVADAVGFRSSGNATVDFGAYDLTRRNAASGQPGFRGNAQSWRDANALCWYDMFPAADAARIRSLAGVGSVEGAQSDVCS